ncbi:MAG TPA: ATP-binding protein [Candidatus Limnocylindrales bacterium]|jgi:signal transduction histidine kinase|nr:ATP-binding protein [Candidatus Limnocylindrales bacterium]
MTGDEGEVEKGGRTLEGLELERLSRRIAALEADHRRAFDQAQREADALFAQYQLSQLIASGGSPVDLGQAVIVELARLSSADAGAIWLGEGGRADLTMIASTGSFGDALPARLASVDEARRLAAARPDLHLLVLGDEPPATVVALQAAERTLDADGLRVAQLARHELAVAFGGARLRETLERERHELSAIVDGATDVILQVDEVRRVVRLNAAGERTLGIAAGAAIGRSCDEVLGCAAAGGHPDDACPLAEVIASGVPIAYRETAIRSALGAPIRAAGGYSRAPSVPGGPVRATAILRDITAARALEELREGFVATVSHELRTPLALIRGYAETVLHFDLEPDQQRDYVDRIHQLTSRLGSLVDQILDVTHLDADPVILERAPVAFGAIVARLHGDLALSGDDARLISDLPANLPTVDVDAGRIGRVLENVVGNALKYAPDGSPVAIGASVEGDRLVATVDDEGIGIPEAERSLVAEPFHRAWNVRESRIPGTGLGLYICRRLVEAHGGQLWLGDRPDGRAGTRVSFSLPLATEPRRRADRPRGTVTGSTTGATRG